MKIYKKGLMIILLITCAIILIVLGLTLDIFDMFSKNKNNIEIFDESNDYAEKDKIENSSQNNYEEHFSNETFNNENNESKDNQIYNDDKIIVDVSGAVKNQGIHELKYGQRVADAIAKAGGYSDDANKEFIAKYINMAKILNDAAKIYIPYIHEKPEDLIKNFSQNQYYNEDTYIDSSIEDKININSADVKTLMKLDGIGEAFAKRIVEYRAKKPFNSIEEIKNVKGIGEKLYEKIKDKIIV